MKRLLKKRKRQRKTRNSPLGLTVIGLGNPGDRFDSSRHNVGFTVLDLLAGETGAVFRKPLLRKCTFARTVRSRCELFLVKPLTYMNLSGVVWPYVRWRSGNGVADTLVVCDNLDLPPGSVRLKRGGSTGGHRGLASLIEWTGDPGFLRLYIGIGRPDSGGTVVDHVLGVPEGETGELIERSCRTAADAILRLLTSTPEAVMNTINARSPD